jgi:predicted ATP-grasp superfamily ATP-dependent carboligase
VAEEATFPCLIKPALSHVWRGRFGDRRVLLVDGPDALAREAGPSLEEGFELLVTEHVPGPDSNLEGALTIRRADGSYSLAYGRRKVRMYPPGYGAASIIESRREPETMELAKRLLEAGDFVGISSVEAKRHAETGERVLIEVNVRVPRWWALGDACGTEASWRLYGTLAGESLGPQPAQIEGVRTVVPSLELRAVVAHLSERRLTVRQVVAGYRGARDASAMSWRDPVPVLMLLSDFARWAWRALRERLRR